jgi:hypothetical protein
MYAVEAEKQVSQLKYGGIKQKQTKQDSKKPDGNGRFFGKPEIVPTI